MIDSRVLDLLPGYVTVVDRDLVITALHGGGGAVDAPALVGRRLDDVFAERATDDTPLRSFRRALAGETVTYDAQSVSGVWYRTRVAPLLDDDGVVTGAVGMTIDIGEQKRLEHDLERSNERFRALLEQAPIMTYITRGVGNAPLFVSPEVERVLGYPPDQTLTDPTVFARILHPDDRDRVLAELPALIAAGRPFEMRFRLQAADGSTKWLNHKAVLFESDEGETLRVGVLVDETEMRETELALAASERRFRELFENARDMVALFDLDFNYVAVNRAAVERLGFSAEELVGRNVMEFLTPESVEVCRAAYEEKARGDSDHTLYEARHRTKDGGIVTLDVSSRLIFDDGVPVGVQAVCRDLTEQRRLEEQLRQAQKMETIGRLAGGLAHDFNNLLTAIAGYGELIDRRLAPEDPVRRELTEIRRAAERATALTSQLLAFSRQQILQPQVVDPNEVVAGLEDMLRRLIGEDVELETRLDESVEHVRVDPTQLEQVIANLVVNARDAMPLGGTVTIESSVVEIPPEAAAPWEIAPGRHVLFRVSDTGDGMDAETAARVFEPFFTTKAVGEGTGLGLATVFGIVRQSGGAVWVESTPGEGARFSFCLPQVHVEPEQDAADASDDADEQLPLPAGPERVLLLEDEQVVRTLVREILEHEGYEVIEAKTPEEALAIGGDDVDALLTDVVMPGMSGPEIASLLSAGNPALRVLFMSGYTDEAVVRRGVYAGTTAFLQKPFTAGELAAKLREVLETPAARVA